MGETIHVDTTCSVCSNLCPQHISGYIVAILSPLLNIVSKDTTKLGLMPQETIFTSLYEDLQVYMRNRYLALTNQITVFVTTMI